VVVPADRRTVGRIFVTVFAVTFVMVSLSGCLSPRYVEMSTEELISTVQGGEYDEVRGNGPACDAAYALGLRRAEAAVDVLIDALSGPAEDCMASALGQISDPRAVEPLLDAMADECHGFDRKLRDDDTYDVQDVCLDFQSADDALIAIGNAAVDPLLALAGAGAEPQAELAVVVLGEIGDTRAEAYLVERLANYRNSTIEPEFVRRRAAEALARIFRSQVESLLPRLQSQPTVGIAYGIIGLGQSSTEPDLIRALQTFGDLPLAEFYLNCGRPSLEAAAMDWGVEHGYTLRYRLPGIGSGTAPRGWGDL